ncbi:MAG: glycoside hydrolase family 3 C-terminal domain-containing protein [Bacteroidales bacterium]|nr:glycoside hydrolase family 3 C-terminal domain-containing protein [Candidatus Liminaster caballi]
MKTILTTTAAMLLAGTCFAQAPQLTQGNIDGVIKAMTLEEKVTLVVGANRYAEIESGPDHAPGMPERKAQHVAKPKSEPQEEVVTAFSSGRVKGAAGDVVPVKRVGITTMVLADGPAGLRIDPTRKDDDQTYYCTAFPIGSLLSASWDPALTQRVTTAMGEEVHEYGADVLLAPAINIHRNPLCGRNFEYYSEDPLLAGLTAAAYIRGIQSQGVGTSLKHFAANNQETMRNGQNSSITERALREIYLKGFEIAVKDAQPWTIMTSYNKVNGVLSSENRWLITDVLRNEWGFKGFVMTDWWAEENGARQIEAGNDMLMPGTPHQFDEIIKAAQSGRLDMRYLDDCVRRILQVMVQSPTFLRYNYSNKPDLKAHAQVVRDAAPEGMVLLKNESVLPLKAGRKVALFGVPSYDIMVGGSGSGYVNRAYKVSLDEGLSAAGFKLDKQITAQYQDYVKGVKANQNENFWVVPVVPETAISAEDAAAAAKRNDVAIYSIGRMAGEGGDRKLVPGDWYLSDLEQKNIDALCDAFHKVGKKVIVLLNMGNIIDMNWSTQPDAVLHTWMGGQEAGHSIADVLAGKVSPSGKLPMTIATKYETYPSANDFPMSNNNPGDVNYDEDIFVGYRHFDRQPADILFPFGFGLSYTQFEYSDLKVSKQGSDITVSVKVTNTGKVAAKEVVQLYVSAPKGQIVKPVKELRAYAKTGLLKAKESEVVTMTVKVDDLRSFDNYLRQWVLDRGTYQFHVAASSQDIRLTATQDL